LHYVRRRWCQYDFGLGIALDNRLHAVRERGLGSAFHDQPLPPAPFGFADHHQIPDAVARVFGVLSGRRAGLGRYGFATLAHQLLRAFVEADHRVRRIVGRYLQVKDVFHRRDKVRADLGETPFPHWPRFQGVFLRGGELFHH